MISDEENWLIAEGEEDDNYLLFRVRSEIPAGALKLEYPQLISVYWSYDGDANDGMPDSDTNQLHFDFETAVEPLDNPETSFMMLVITGAGQKEWHFYARNDEQWIGELNTLLTDHPEYPLEIEISQDPDWSLYMDVMLGISQAETDEEDDDLDDDDELGDDDLGEDDLDEGGEDGEVEAEGDSEEK